MDILIPCSYYQIIYPPRPSLASIRRVPSSRPSIMDGWTRPMDAADGRSGWMQRMDAADILFDNINS